MKRGMALAAALTMGLSPAMAADIAEHSEHGARRSGAGLGAYLAVPLGGPRALRAQAGLRLRVTHDYRSAVAHEAAVVHGDAFDLRLVGDRKATLYMAGRPLDRQSLRRASLSSGATIALVAVGVGAVIGIVAISSAISDSGGE